MEMEEEEECLMRFDGREEGLDDVFPTRKKEEREEREVVEGWERRLGPRGEEKGETEAMLLLKGFEAERRTGRRRAEAMAMRKGRE
jgi:hypothetical protein